MNMTDHAARLPEAVRRIVAWYAEVRRPLPWRQNPSPYETWLAEIMLQQTRIEAVIPYYARFLAELPDIAALAEVPEDRLLKLWEGLGYYSRARNLKKAAQRIMEYYGGALPASAPELKTLPGIGDYTAGAIASIAFGLPEPAVDGNVLRVITRLLACPEDISSPATRREVTRCLRGCYPEGPDAGLLTEGLMELGETVCLPNGVPLCGICPLREICLAHASGQERAFPVRSSPKARRTEEITVLLLRCRGRYALRKRPAEGLLAGLWEFPNEPGFLSPEEILVLLRGREIPVTAVSPAGEAKHIFTHVEWRMRGFFADCADMPPDFLWLSPEDIRREIPLPVAFRAFQNKILSHP